MAVAAAELAYKCRDSINLYSAVDNMGSTYIFGTGAACGGGFRASTSDAGGCGDRKKREGESGESGEAREHVV